MSNQFFARISPEVKLSYLTDLQKKVLLWIKEGKHESINAAVYADAIVSLINIGLVSLSGTLQNAIIELSEDGNKIAEELLKEKR